MRILLANILYRTNKKCPTIMTSPAPSAAADTLFERIGTWWTILKISLDERFVYRADFALGTLMRFLPIITQVFLWGAVFQAIESRPGATASESSIRGYSYSDFIAYYLLTMIGRAFSSMPGLAGGIARQIRDGEIKKFLVQPVDFLGFLLLSRIAHKLAYYFVATIPFALVFLLCSKFFPEWPSWTTWLAFLTTLILGFALGFFLEAAMGLVGFWFLEVSSLLFVFMLLSFFLSGHMFPLDMLPQPWGSILEWLPFRYLAYFPAAVYLGKIQGGELAIALLVEFACPLPRALCPRCSAI
jgi:ABC-2 type transport system permease protein